MVEKCIAFIFIVVRLDRFGRANLLWKGRVRKLTQMDRNPSATKSLSHLPILLMFLFSEKAFSSGACDFATLEPFSVQSLSTFVQVILIEKNKHLPKRAISSFLWGKPYHMILSGYSPEHIQESLKFNNIEINPEFFHSVAKNILSLEQASRFLRYLVEVNKVSSSLIEMVRSLSENLVATEARIAVNILNRQRASAQEWGSLNVISTCNAYIDLNIMTAFDLAKEAARLSVLGLEIAGNSSESSFYILAQIAAWEAASASEWMKTNGLIMDEELWIGEGRHALSTGAGREALRGASEKVKLTVTTLLNKHTFRDSQTIGNLSWVFSEFLMHAWLMEYQEKLLTTVYHKVNNRMKQIFSLQNHNIVEGVTSQLLEESRLSRSNNFYPSVLRDLISH